MRIHTHTHTHTHTPEALNLLSETCLTLKLLSPLTPSLMFTARNKWREEEERERMRERRLGLRCVYTRTHTPDPEALNLLSETCLTLQLH